MQIRQIKVVFTDSIWSVTMSAQNKVGRSFSVFVRQIADIRPLRPRECLVSLGISTLSNMFQNQNSDQNLDIATRLFFFHRGGQGLINHIFH